VTGIFVAWNPDSRTSPGWIEDGTGCWVWCGSTGEGGYGRASIGGKVACVVRVLYERHRGPIPAGLVLDHLCRNPGCVNPWHVEPVTQRENVLRGVGVTAQNAKKDLCPNGHRYDVVTTQGYRSCRPCYIARKRRQRAAEGSAR
jgi:hypothetical protein